MVHEIDCQDTNIQNSREINMTATHRKSFISMDFINNVVWRNSIIALTQSIASHLFATKSQNFWLNWKHEETKECPRKRHAFRYLILFLFIAVRKQTSRGGARTLYEIGDPWHWGGLRPQYIGRKRNENAAIFKRAKVDRFHFYQVSKLR